ncbi:IucA/IucC family protein [Rubritalea spongiae]|uniref:IucA/IucC family protein n=1 Tax=Rubritalea spongiae TaxID=430797 RepID=A0ABW5DYC5_9BACT
MGLKVGLRRGVDFISSEQDSRWGHWFHPTPKNRVGMADWQEELYCPEYQRGFQLHYFAVHSSLLKVGGISRSYYDQIMLQCLGEDFKSLPEGFAYVVCHPLQASKMRVQEGIRELIGSGILLDVGVKGREFYATSSVRTVYNSEVEMMLKLSIPVKITNSVRSNKVSDLEYCEQVVKAVKYLGLGDSSDGFTFLADRGQVSVQYGDAELGFESLFRENPFYRKNTEGVVNPVALFEEALPGMKSQTFQLVTELAYKDELPLKLAAQVWFENYITVTLLCFIELYDEFGVTFESHLQNCLIKIEECLPVKLYYRDTEGCYIDESLSDDLTEEFPRLASLSGVFFSRKEMHEAVGYYHLINHVFAVVCRFGVDGLLEEELGIDLIHRLLRKKEKVCGERGRALIWYLLDSKMIQCKSNLITQLEGIDELAGADAKAAYVEVKNPLYVGVEKQLQN